MCGTLTERRFNMVDIPNNLPGHIWIQLPADLNLGSGWQIRSIEVYCNITGNSLLGERSQCDPPLPNGEEMVLTQYTNAGVQMRWNFSQWLGAGTYIEVPLSTNLPIVSAVTLTDARVLIKGATAPNITSGTQTIAWAEPTRVSNMTKSGVGTSCSAVFTVTPQHQLGLCFGSFTIPANTAVDVPVTIPDLKTIATFNS
jgi:hypothetical protein